MGPSQSKILVVFNDEHKMIDDTLGLLKELGKEFIVSREPAQMNKPILEKYTHWHSIIDKVIVIMNPSVWDYEMDDNPGNACTRARQSTVFELGFWLGKVGRDRLIGLYYDQKSFRIPCEFFDLRFIAWQKKGPWREELKGFLTNATP